MAIRPSAVTTPVVYVIQENSHRNMTSALDYGPIELLLQEEEEATMLNIPRIVAKIKYGLRNYKKADYLILIGSPVAIGIACAVASEMTGGVFNCLKWDGQERRYWEAKVNLNQSER